MNFYAQFAQNWKEKYPKSFHFFKKYFIKFDRKINFQLNFNQNETFCYMKKSSKTKIYGLWIH